MFVLLVIGESSRLTGRVNEIKICGLQEMKMASLVCDFELVCTPLLLEVASVDGY